MQILAEGRRFGVEIEHHTVFYRVDYVNIRTTIDPDTCPGNYLCDGGGTACTLVQLLAVRSVLFKDAACCITSQKYRYWPVLFGCNALNYWQPPFSLVIKQIGQLNDSYLLGSMIAITY
jgi:hypothetical protein